MRNTGHGLRWLGYFMVTVLLARVPRPTCDSERSNPAYLPPPIERTRRLRRATAHCPSPLRRTRGRRRRGLRFVAHGKGVAFALSPTALTLAIGGGHPTKEQAATIAPS